MQSPLIALFHSALSDSFSSLCQQGAREPGANLSLNTSHWPITALITALVPCTASGKDVAFNKEHYTADEVICSYSNFHPAAIHRWPNVAIYEEKKNDNHLFLCLCLSAASKVLIAPVVILLVVVLGALALVIGNILQTHVSSNLLRWERSTLISEMVRLVVFLQAAKELSYHLFSVMGIFLFSVKVHFFCSKRTKLLIQRNTIME